MTTNIVGILVLPSSNLKSIINALGRIEASYKLVENAADLMDINKLIIPGVGSFLNTMQYLNHNHMIEPLKSYALSGKPLLGICLGMQILMTWGDEGGGSEGLNLIAGKVLAFDKNDSEFRVPHVGWNNLNVTNNSSLFDDIPLDADFYFTHSYYVSTLENQQVLAHTEHGISFVSVLCKDSIYGVQFHPEKSGKYGMKLLRNFIYNA